MRDDWIEIKYKDLVDKVSTSKQKIKQKEYLQKGLYPVIDQGQELIGGYTDNKKNLLKCQLPAIVFGDHTKIVKLINFQFAPGADGTKVLEPKKFVAPEYLTYLSQILVLKIKDKGYARHYQHIEKQRLFLAPLPEQRAIVAKIDQLFSDLDNGISNLKVVKAKLEIYRQAVLKKAFEGELTKDWREKQTHLPIVDEILEQIKEERQKRYQKQVVKWEQVVLEWEMNGKVEKRPVRISKPKLLSGLTEEEVNIYGVLPNKWAWSRFCNVTYKIGDIDHKMPKTYPGGIPYLSTGNLKSDGSIDFKGIKTISKEDYYRLSLKIKPEKGDIIFPRYGTIGRNILINFDKEFLVSYSCAIIKNIPSIINEKYVYYYSLSYVIQNEIKKYTVQTTQANIGISSIENFVFPLCSTEEQHAIVQAIESRLSVCDKLSKSIDQSLKKAKALRQSILKKAFEGKLLTEAELQACRQEPDWEPAKKLLARIN
ncbi:MAG: restriction endonuclease subunit S, partial [Candidatus Zophobacter franzmannii]|nr:restriction endonuclease subunit S [Candidatus Zophobacter franzmannii]